MPVPLKVTWAELPEKLSTPVRVPTAVGVKVSWKAQLPPEASVAPQVVKAMAKSPLMDGLTVTAAPPLFVAVTVTDDDVVLTTTEPKVSLVGERVRVPGVTPVPESAAVAGLGAKLPAMLSVPVAGPAAVGEKATCTVQLAEGASDAPQVVEARENGPVSAGACRLTAMPPLFVAVNVADDEAPIATDPKV
jgi:hypothetical protein